MVLSLLHQMLQVRVVLDALHFTYNDIHNVGFYTLVIAFDFLLHFVFALLIRKGQDLRYLLIGFGFGSYLFIVHYNFNVKYFLVLRSSIVNNPVTENFLTASTPYSIARNNFF